MKVYTAVTWGTGDGMEPDVLLSLTLDGIKELALSYTYCSGCGEAIPQCDCDEPDDLAVEASVQIKEWNGEDDLTTYYFDGNEGHMSLGWSEL